VLDDGGEPLRCEYAVGWIKRGPSGVIGTNKKCATDTVERILEDVDQGRLRTEGSKDPEAWLRERVPGLVTWEGWKAIDRRESDAGAAQGRPRVKLVRVPDMLDAASPTLTGER
jgi:ferredoxin--NADP+ reductase